MAMVRIRVDSAVAGCPVRRPTICVVSENSRGFHAPAYTNRLLNDVTDASRRGQMALRGVEYQPAGAPTPAPVGQPTLAPDKRK